MPLFEFERSLAANLPSAFLKDVFPRGMRRLAELGLFRRAVEVPTKFGFRMMADRLDVVKWYVYYFGQIEPQISLAWNRLLTEGDEVIDIGGNVGYYALLAGKLVGSKGLVITIEPSQTIFDQLVYNIGINGFEHVKPIKKAVSNTNGTIKLYYAGDNNQGNTTIMEENGHIYSEDVECITFGEIGRYIELSKVKLIKIDVEGAEPMVLSSLSQSLEKLNPDVVIFVEISPSNTEDGEKMLAPFTEAGFEARLIPNEYDTAFYRNTNDVTLRPLCITPGVIHDVIMTRNPAKFDVIEGKV
jgi:FkbM family methyltransferase